jgi:hypothetical protein
MSLASPVVMAADLGSQLRQLNNALCILAKSEHPLRNQAAELRKVASAVWQVRAAQRQWFPWPTTAAPRGTQKLQGIFWRTQGMLDLFGYHVGETKPVAAEIRWRILEYMFEFHLPPLNDVAYLLEWGEPRTAARLRKLANTLAALARNAKRRDAFAYTRAIDDWENDLALLHDSYYARMFSFGWPSTSSFH